MSLAKEPHPTSPKLRALPLHTWLGGPYCIMLQLAHPRIAAASCAHSRFVTEGISRLRRTAAYITSLSHGTEKEQRIIAGMITRQHVFIKDRRCPDRFAEDNNGDTGSASSHGTRCIGDKRGSSRKGQGQTTTTYDARDPALQKWVAATLFRGMLLTDQTFRLGHGSMTAPWERWLFKTCRYFRVKPPRTAMSRPEQEILLQEASCLATSLDMPHQMWFSCLEEFEDYFEGMVTGGDDQGEGLFMASSMEEQPPPESNSQEHTYDHSRNLEYPNLDLAQYEAHMQFQQHQHDPLHGHGPGPEQERSEPGQSGGSGRPTQFLLSEASRKMGTTLLYEMKLPFWFGFWLLPLMRLLVTAWLPDNLRTEFGLASLKPGSQSDSDSHIIPYGGPCDSSGTGSGPPCAGRFTAQTTAALKRWIYIVLVWFFWLIDWLLPVWLEAWIVSFLVSDMQFAAREIERTGRWPM